MTEFEKTWQEIDAIEKKKTEEAARLLQQQETEEAARQEKQIQIKAKEEKIHSNYAFMQKFVPSYLKQINKEFFSNKGSVSSWEKKETETHTYHRSWEYFTSGGADPTCDSGSITSFHRILKYEIELSTPNGKLAIFVPLKVKAKERDYDSQNIKRALSLVGWVDKCPGDLYINEDCTCTNIDNGRSVSTRNLVPLSSERDELLTNFRKKILTEVVKLKTSEKK